MQASGALSATGSALIGLDNGIKAVIDLKSIAAKILPPPKFVPIKQVVIPPVRKMPTKSPKKGVP